MTARYYRARDGKKIHRNACRHKGTAVPWEFAAQMTHAQVLNVIDEHEWLSACQFCMFSAEVFTDLDRGAVR